jgi:tetratricopeptide (TPR) repeat protein
VKPRRTRLLAPLARDLAEFRIRCGRPGDDELVFGEWTGDDWDNWRERIFQPAAIAVGLPDDTIPRDLRGSFARLLIFEGLNVLEVAPQLGHKPSTCLDIYGRLFEEFELAWDLARRGLVDDAVRVADAFAALDPQHRSMHAGDAAVIVAEAGRADEARARADANVHAFPRDVWTHVHAGDVHRELGDHEQAERAFRRAGALAEGAGDSYDRAVVAQRLSDLLAGVPGREREAAEAARAAKRTYFGQRIAATTGRNDPCPCGSGRKFKKCCGS